MGLLRRPGRRVCSCVTRTTADQEPSFRAPSVDGDGDGGGAGAGEPKRQYQRPESCRTIEASWAIESIVFGRRLA